MRVALWLSVIVTAILLGALTSGVWRVQPSRGAQSIHVALVGASIGQAWDLAGWPARAGTQAFSAESIAVWKFDKTEAIEALLMRPAVKFRIGRTYLRSLVRPPRKPDLVILKECSAYFPGDLVAYRGMIRRWVGQMRAGRINVALATVVPVTEDRARRDPGKQEALLTYNRWVRDYAAQEKLPLLDLEEALRAEGETAYLRPELALEDGSHLNAKAYALLDHYLRELVTGATSTSARF